MQESRKRRSVYVLTFGVSSCFPDNKSQPDLQRSTEKQRVTVPHGDTHYSFLNYVAYVLYPPLYIAGPIMTFNDFMWQVSFGVSSNELKSTAEFSIEDHWGYHPI